MPFLRVHVWRRETDEAGEVPLVSGHSALRGADSNRESERVRLTTSAKTTVVKKPDTTYAPRH